MLRKHRINALIPIGGDGTFLPAVSYATASGPAWLAVADLDGVAIGFWRVSGAQAEEVARAVGDGPVYIADGHHRYETALNYRNWVHAGHPNLSELAGAEVLDALGYAFR